MDPFIAAAIRYFVKPRIQHLTLFVTQRCNIRCRTCFVDFSETKQENELSLEEIEGIRKVLGRMSVLNIGGGEPFLREDLTEIIKIFSECCSIGLPTNGWYTEKVIAGIEKILKTVEQSQLGLMISIDGFEKTHDFIRVKGSFARAVETLREVKKHFPRLLIQVNTVLCEYNRPEMLDLIEFIKQFQPSHHSIFLLRGRPMDNACVIPPLDQVRSLLPGMLERLKGYDYQRRGLYAFVARNYHRYMLDLSLRILENKRQLVPCLAGRASLVIYADGSVAPCELLDPVGNLRAAGLEAVLKSRAYRDCLQKIKQKKCYCTHNCNMTENILFNPANYPRLLGFNIGGY